jgi:hypothetical protein
MSNIDEFLIPLVEELKTLWMLSVQVLDLAKLEEQQFFNLDAMIMWTINDFPWYGLLSGLYTKDILLVLNVSQK